MKQEIGKRKKERGNRKEERGKSKQVRGKRKEGIKMMLREEKIENKKVLIS